jgi:hypothetical protein
MAGASGWQSLGEALGGGAVPAQMRGMMMGAQFQDMNAMGANALSQIPLHGAQTALALANARMAQNKGNWQANVAGTSNADLSNPDKAPLGELMALGLGSSYQAGIQGLNRAVLGTPTDIGTPQATAAAQAVSGKIATPIAVPKEFVTPAGLASPAVTETPGGAASIASQQARTNFYTKEANSFVGGVRPPSGYMADPNNPGHVIPVPGGPADVGASWTPQAIDQAAQRYRLSGSLPPVGFGSAGQVIRGQIISRAADQATQMGDSSSAAAYRQIANKANETALAAVTKQQQMVGSYEQTALANMGLAESALGKVDLSGSPLINKAIIAWKQGVAGDPSTAAYVNALTTAQNEYAKVLSGATGSTGITDAARREANDLFSKISSPAQIHQVFQIARQEMANRMSAFQTQQAQLHQMIVGGPSGGAPAPVTASAGHAGAPTVPQFTEGQTAINRATGQRLIFRGGQWQPVQ